jgi:luciferase family oxidoreductase group 1
MSVDRRVPLSVLDLSVVAEGATSTAALADTTLLARRAEALGYTRFWVAEHHNMPLVASTTPAVLIAHLAAATSTIRVGSGGVMLPNHAPLVVAEQFAMLEALHPGRVDLGIGRAPGTDPVTAAALRPAPATLGAEEFPHHLIDLMGMLGDRRSADGMWNRFVATPAATTAPAIVLLGSSDYSAQLAGRLGLRFAFAHHFDTGGTLDALDLYRRNFEPSTALEQPYAIVTASVLTAETEEEAAWFAAPGQLMTLAIRTGRLIPLLPPQAAAAHPDLATARRFPTNRIVGAPGAVVARLENLLRETAANEIMVFTLTHGIAERVRSLELLAQAWRRLEH